MKTMHAMIIIALGLLLTDSATAKLKANPEISFAGIDPANPDYVYLRFDYAPCQSAFSTNAGASFQVAATQDLPPNVGARLSAGSRRYVVLDACRLIRSDDNGTTWTNTAIASFLREQRLLEEGRMERKFELKYGAQIPARSDYWHAVFGAFAAICFLLIIRATRTRGWLYAIYTGLRGVIVILLVWSLLICVHELFMNLMHWPIHYDDSHRFLPNYKLGVLMAITARPLPLLAYLLVLWPLLPGSIDVMTGKNEVSLRNRRRMALMIAVTAGIAFAGLHMYMLFSGSFSE